MIYRRQLGVVEVCQMAAAEEENSVEDLPEVTQK